MNAIELLLPASRQYRHNNVDYFVDGYDKEETVKIVSGLQKEVHRLMLDTVRLRAERTRAIIEKEFNEDESIIINDETYKVPLMVSETMVNLGIDNKKLKEDNLMLKKIAENPMVILEPGAPDLDPDLIDSPEPEMIKENKSKPEEPKLEPQFYKGYLV